MKNSRPPLRILAIVNLPWDPRLGASRVWIELAEEWRRAGHVVEKFCLTDAFPQPTSSRFLSILRQAIFPHRAAAFVRTHAARFDVVDCLIGTLPFRKRALNFRGLLVARSVGLYRLYDVFLRRARTRWPDQPKGRLLGGIFHRIMARYFRRNADAAVRRCDLLNVPNDDERGALLEEPRAGKPTIVQPYGLSDDFRHAFASAAAAPAERLRSKKICFIGMWSLRKGSRDWRAIMRGIWHRHPAAEFFFLGTMVDEKIVRAELDCGDDPRVTCLTSYDAADLPRLLAETALGLFPSYVEGFGLAVIEQLAAGVPTIAYDAPGPRQILHRLREKLLTPAGNVAALSARASEILALPLPEYEQLSADCRALAADFRWSEIAAATAQDYRAALDSLGNDGA